MYLAKMISAQIVLRHLGCDIEECPVCGEAIYGDCECQLILPDLADMEEMLK